MYGSNDKAFGEGEESQEQPMYLQREKKDGGTGIIICPCWKEC